MLSIFNKELAGYFSSLTAYITIGVFLVVSWLLIWIFPDSSILEYGYAGLDSFFNLAPYLFMFLIPGVTMRSIAEERKDGTFELLATRPLSDWEIVLGKYFAAMAVIVVCLAITSIYYYTVYSLGLPEGNLDTGAVVGSYIGLILLSSVFTAIGLFASSIGKNQIVSLSIAVFFCYATYLGFDSASSLLSLQGISGYISWISINQHYQSISRGVLDSRDLIYFLTSTVLFLMFTKTILGGRKW